MTNTCFNPFQREQHKSAKGKPATKKEDLYLRRTYGGRIQVPTMKLFLCAACRIEIDKKIREETIAVPAQSSIVQTSVSTRPTMTSRPSSSRATPCASMALPSSSGVTRPGPSGTLTVPMSGRPSLTPRLAASAPVVLSADSSASSEPVSRSTSDEQPSGVEIRVSDDDFQTEQVALKDIDTTFENAGISPLLQRSRGVRIKREVGQKWRRLTSNLSKKLKMASGSAKSSLSPVKHVSVPKRKACKTCRNCATLIAGLQLAFQKAASKQDKYRILTCVPKSVSIERIQLKFQCSLYMARKSRNLQNSKGFFSAPTLRLGRPVSINTVATVKSFYCSEDNSRILPTQKDTVMVFDEVTQRKERRAKQHILMNLDQLYNEYKWRYIDQAERKISLSLFAKLRPRNCIFPGKRGFHITCACITHENFKLLLNACKINKFKTGEILAPCVCSVDSEDCMLGNCEDCPKPEGVASILKELEHEEGEEDEKATDTLVEYYRWTSTDRTEMIQELASVEDFRDRLNAYIPVILKHHFIVKKQKEFIAEKKANLKDDDAVLVQVDFSENYSFIVQNEVQGFHWNNSQATVHPFVVSYHCPITNETKNRSYIVISDELEHSASTFHIFLDEFVTVLKQDCEKNIIPPFTNIIYVSDGAASQYKNYKNFINLANHQMDYEFPAEWHFTGSAHGKSMCDAMGAVSKRTTRLISLKGEIITNALKMHEVLVRERTEGREFIYVSKEGLTEKKELLEKRYEGVKPIKGTRGFHSFIPVSPQEVSVRTYSSATNFKVVRIADLVEEPTPITDIAVGQHVAFIVNRTWELGIVATDDIYEMGDVFINFMRRQNKANSFAWSDFPRDDWVNISDILCVTDVPDTPNGRLYKLNEPEYNRIQQLFKTKLANVLGG